MNGPPLKVENVLRIAILDLCGHSTATGRSILDRVPRELRNVVELVPTDPSLAEGARQKRGLRACIEAGYGIAVILRVGDEKLADFLPQLCQPLLQAAAAAVVAAAPPVHGPRPSRSLSVGALAESRLISAARSFVPGVEPSDAHAGGRLYALAALAKVPFEKNADDLRFDAQVLVQLRAAGLGVVAMPLPEAGPAPRSTHALGQARELLKSALAFKLHELGLATDARFELPALYTMKQSAHSSHAALLDLVGEQPQRILDVGCGQGQLGSILRARGHHVTGIDMEQPRFELDEFVRADLARGLSLAADRRFDLVLLADLLEHMPEPLGFLRTVLPHVAERGALLVSLPNAVHWSVRGQVALGRFDYTNKGLLDRGHLRFFTRASARRLFRDAGLAVEAEQTTPVPWENVVPSGLKNTLAVGLENVDHALGRAWPNLFAYQHIFKLRRSDGHGPTG